MKPAPGLQVATNFKCEKVVFEKSEKENEIHKELIV